MNYDAFLKKYLRPDIFGIFNEVHILKYRRKRFEHSLHQDVILPPYEVLIHPCSKCNLSCEWCIGGNVSTKEAKNRSEMQTLPSTLMDPDKMEIVVRNIIDYEREIEGEGIYKIDNVSFSGIVGEPFVAKSSFIKAIDLLAKANKRLGVFSNTTLMDDEIMRAVLKMDYINISLDVATPELFQKVKYSGREGGKILFHKVIKNVKKLVKYRNEDPNSNLKINASYILYPSNYQELYLAGKMLKEIGIDNFRMKQDNSGKRMLSNKQMKETKELIKKTEELEDEKFHFIKVHRLNEPSEMKRTSGSCPITNLVAAIGSDGKLYPCNYHPRVGGYSFGSVIENSFQEVWEGDKRKEIMEKVPSICPKVCDPFKTRANKLFEQIGKYEKRNGKEKTNELINKITEEVNI